MAQAAADAFQERLVLFAVGIIDLVTCLPKTTAGRQRQICCPKRAALKEI